MNGLVTADYAYRALLRLSFSDPFRIRNQGLYAALLDCIATETGLDAETVQSYYESRGNGVDSATGPDTGHLRKRSIIEEVQGFMAGAAGQD